MSAADLNRPATPFGRALARRVPRFSPTESDVRGAPEALDLTSAEPHQPAAPVREAAKNALLHGETHYTSRTGIMPLRRVIADVSTAEGFPADVDGTAVTNGGAEAIYIALQTMLLPGDRAVLIEPVSPRVVDVVRFIGAEPVFVADFSDAQLAGCKVVVVSSPSALSSVALPDERLTSLIEAADRENVRVIVDRSAAPDCYQPAPPFTRPDLAEGVITIGSFSGSYGLDGWQVGYFTAPLGSMEPLATLKESMSISTTTVSQFAALAALEHAQELKSDRREHFTARRDVASKILGIHGVTVIQPDVYPWLLIDIRRSGLDDRRFADRLREFTGVIVEPASLYGTSLAGYVRINLGVRETTLVEGIARLAAFVEAG